tara:strand:- start:63 stop:404 length:342 start_codon:yes stop_codon:yes gene_type:complete
MAGPLAALGASYLAGKAKNMIEEKAGLPSGTLGKMRNPVGILTGELKDRMMDTARGVASGSIKPGGKVGKSGEQMPDTEEDEVDNSASAFKKGGKVRRIDGCAQRGKTKGKIV